MKEEILTRLKDIQSAIENDSLAKEYTTDEVKQNLEVQKQRLSSAITVLSEKTADENNFISASYLEAEAKLRDVEKNKLDIMKAKSDNSSLIKSLEQEVLNINRDLDAGKELLSEVQNNTQNYNPNRLDSDLDYLNSEMSLLEARRDNVTKQLDSIKERQNQLEEQEKNIEKEETLFKERLQNLESSKIDKKKIEYFTKVLDAAKARLNLISSKNPSLLLNFKDDFEDLINSIEYNYITYEGILNRVKILKTKYPSKNKEEVAVLLKDNHELQDNVNREIQELKSLLSDDINYSPSRLQKAQLEEELKVHERNINNCDVSIESLTASALVYQKSRLNVQESIEDVQKMIRDIEEENKEYGLRLALETSLTQKEIEQILKNINKNKKKIKMFNKNIGKYETTILSLDTSLKSLESSIKNLQSLKSKEVKEKEEKLKTLEDTTTIDYSEKNKDEQNLKRLESELAALKLAEKSINYDYTGKLNEIANLVKNNKKASVEKEMPEEAVPIVAPIAPQGEPSTSPIVENNEEKGFVLVDNNDTANNQPEEQEEKGLSVVTPTVNPFVPPKIDNEPIKIKAWLGKAKNKILEKLKDKKFMRKVKATVAAAIIAFTMGLGLSKCSNQPEMNSKNNIELNIDTDKEIDKDLLPDDSEIEEDDPKIDEDDLELGEDGTKPTEPIDQENPEPDKPEPENPEPENPEPENPEPDKPEPDKPEPENPEPENPEPENPEPENPEPENPEPDKPEPEPEPEDKETQVVESGQVGILQTDDDTVTVTDNVDLTTGEENTPQQQVAQEIIDRLEQEGNEIGTSLDDPNVDSSTVSDDGTITNTYEDNTTPGDKTVEDVIEEIANENHDGEVSDDIWNDLNDLYLEEIGENSEEIGGKSR